jgi:hypothetical protein
MDWQSRAGLQVADLTLLDSPMWVQHYLACETDGISVAANDLRASNRPLDLGPGVRPEAVFVTPPMQPYQGE